jgi:hypothetical protein
MSGEIEPYEGGQFDRRSRKEIERMKKAEAAARAAAEAHENVSAYEDSLRLANGRHLTAQAQAHLNSLDAHTSATAADKPGLEMHHRHLQSSYIVAAGEIIYSYMTRPRRYQ